MKRSILARKDIISGGALYSERTAELNLTASDQVLLTFTLPEPGRYRLDYNHQFSVTGAAGTRNIIVTLAHSGGGSLVRGEVYQSQSGTANQVAALTGGVILLTNAVHNINSVPTSGTWTHDGWVTWLAAAAGTLTMSVRLSVADVHKILWAEGNVRKIG